MIAYIQINRNLYWFDDIFLLLQHQKYRLRL